MKWVEKLLFQLNQGEIQAWLNQMQANVPNFTPISKNSIKMECNNFQSTNRMSELSLISNPNIKGETLPLPKLKIHKTDMKQLLHCNSDFLSGIPLKTVLSDQKLYQFLFNQIGHHVLFLVTWVLLNVTGIISKIEQYFLYHKIDGKIDSVRVNSSSSNKV